MLDVPFWIWLVFAGVVLASLVVDLLSHRGGHGLGRRAAIIWSVVWIAIAMLFAGWVGLRFGAEVGGDFVAAYLMEKSLSVDNVFVFLVVFSQLKIPPEEQHRVLFWGILGALIARALFIAAGTAILQRWHDVVYVLGVFLLVAGWKTARAGVQPAGDSGRILSFLRRHLPITSARDGHRFFTRERGRLVATPLLVALITIEITDILFAVDSVPAVFAISEDPFIVYSSNVFAILGLRALYLVLADLIRNLVYLHYGLGAILAFAGVKLIISGHVHLPHVISLGAIVVILATAVIASLIAKRRRRAPEEPAVDADLDRHGATSTPGR